MRRGGNQQLSPPAAGPAGNKPQDTRNRTINATADNLTLAKNLAATIGQKQFWCLQLDGGSLYVVSDAYGQYGSGRRFCVTDDDAIALARKAGVVCNDDGMVL